MPLFFSALPQRTGTRRLAMVAARRPALISSTVSSSPSRYLIIRSSFVSATISISFARCSSASARSSSGIAATSGIRAKDVGVIQRLQRQEVDDALEVASWPIGSWIGAAFAPRRSRIISIVRQKSAPVRSILLMKQTRGTLYRRPAARPFRIAARRRRPRRTRRRRRRARAGRVRLRR